ncbi:MAG: putative signal transducing protein [Bacteroidota bacterium]|jgi:hypothetical protein
MENDWVKIYTTTQPMQAQIVLGLLHENGIFAVELNKRDSSYTVFGNIDIYCNPEQEMEARQLLSNTNLHVS